MFKIMAQLFGNSDLQPLKPKNTNACHAGPPFGRLQQSGGDYTVEVQAVCKAFLWTRWGFILGM